MGDDEMTALVARWWSLWLQGDVDLVDEICTDPYVRHTSMGTERLSRRQYKKRLASSMNVMLGATTTIDDQVVAGDRVWTRATSRGVTLSTDQPSVLTWIVVHRIEDGRIAETWSATLPGVEWDGDERSLTPGRG